ncbi:MAG TPA: hypothetical protein VNG69_08455 [Casimicrobiaceae bacterium]|nr:hypothetical protein [Casimicrobiaceae bacterium]
MTLKLAVSKALKAGMLSNTSLVISTPGVGVELHVALVAKREAQVAVGEQLQAGSRDDRQLVERLG